MNTGWPHFLVLAIMLTGCSFQADRPAPVDSLSSNNHGPRYHKGSLKTNKYKVKKGDTLYSIAWGAGRNFVDVARLNHLSSPYIIYPGQVLNLAATNNRPSTTVRAPQPYVTSVQTQAVTKPYISSSNRSQLETIKPKDIPKPSPAVVSARTKKVLDHKVKPAYSVTTTQQTINQSAIGSVANLPQQVQQWHWPVRGRIVGYFSASEQGNQGIKIAGNRGDIIKAAADGRVVYAGNALRGYGNLVIIKHNDDFLSAYAHADTILVKEKQYVSAGQTVAKMGSTGTNQVMLHFEVRFHGKSVNPLRYLPKQ
ncbi:peptidase M23 [Shewanella sp. Actino-trap-3]|jgi:lipoprotein NlpD|uniref:LysM peptidoglycan-binding domain-containing protein n=2 Tax=Shewanellaceae TaxID=267890 RepID=A0A3N4E9V0_9GAMM|nr:MULTISPECIES: peptidoglycan DD-metalloendopeptidase family protein [Shewanella]AZG37120.1 LysM peptidoglycan-binding domain-containing protein [Shewanella psychromarinicola]MCL1083221.1 peptidoglycan DD-metalloendopeptidase family protein [Shewanella psychromarinicola]PKG78337.1 peptidase M23 [Shewanella sp. Actino-trap-3]RPA34975.1 LysM peptidoglycan-binding domain-containing protein [Shewanella psychromarinicola]|tara:strand:- start:9871 stop:10800 length:930 start_codon:yes stop_codon:yes gene_type:complete